MKTKNREIKFRAWDKVSKLMAYPKSRKINVIGSIYQNDTPLIARLDTKSYFNEEYAIATPYGKNKTMVEYFHLDQILGMKHRFIPMLYIGLKDRNEIEVYEGDIVYIYTTRHIKSTCIVEFTNTPCADIRARAISHEMINPTKTPYKLFHIFSDKTEVIGNIYENPKLLVNKQT